MLRVRHDDADRLMLGVWRGWADDLRGGRALDCGHHLSEEAPDQLVAELRAFLSR
jgi:haloacetate dehalogenase